MNVQSWDDFVDYFLSCIAKIVPSTQFFAYETDFHAKTPNAYFFKNIASDSITSYIDHMSMHDPIFYRNNLASDQEVFSLKDKKVSDQYQTFLDQNNIMDNVELVFKTDQHIVRGISLVRTQQEGLFTKQELGILESCHALAKHMVIQVPTNNLAASMVAEYRQLTNKEKKVLDLILQGKGNQDIANTLFISLATVKTHLQHIFQKMLVRSKSELIIKTMPYH